MIKGRAITIKRVLVTYNDKSAMAGYSENDADENADALISFMPKVKNPQLIDDLAVKGRKATIVKTERSLYINGMWDFQIKYVEA